jgi:hypothetical protein
VCSRGLQKQCAHLLRIGLIAYPYWQRHADGWVIGSPVGDRIIYKFVVGHNDHDVIVGPNPGRAGCDPDHVAKSIFGLDAVADADRLLDEQNQAGDKVGDDILQSEAYTNAEGAPPGPRVSSDLRLQGNAWTSVSTRKMYDRSSQVREETKGHRNPIRQVVVENASYTALVSIRRNDAQSNVGGDCDQDDRETQPRKCKGFYER